MAIARNSLTKTSKFLSLVLRHQPEVVGLRLDPEGWLSIDELIANANRLGKHLRLSGGDRAGWAGVGCGLLWLLKLVSESWEHSADLAKCAVAFKR